MQRGEKNNCSHTYSTTHESEEQQGTHTSKEMHQWLQCENNFAEEKVLTNDFRPPRGEKKHQLEHCGKAFSHKHNLMTHLRTYTLKKPHQCDQCGMAFSRKQTLTVHQRRHTGEKPHKCEQCGMAFADSSSFRVHLRRHTGEKRHQCEQCGMAFVTSSTLKRHLDTHINEKQHRMEQCGGYFPQKSDHTSDQVENNDIQAGIRIQNSLQGKDDYKSDENQVQPFVCNICNLPFETWNSMRRHQKTTHTRNNTFNVIQQKLSS